MLETRSEATKTLLIIDDIPMFRDLCALFLARSGRVLTAEDGISGIAIAEVERPDLVLVDFHMPKFDGEHVCKAIRRNPDLQHTALIVMVSEDQPQDRARALRAGADSVISKPISRVALINDVNRYLREPVVRGQPRLEVAIPIRLRHRGKDLMGTARNISRGGIYVETDRSLAPNSELDLQFILPETERLLHPSAQVLWRRVRAGDSARVGLGLRFLEIDGDSVRHLEDYIYERATPPSPSTQGVSP